MSLYAVVDPATGETGNEYPTITDEQLRDAIALAHGSREYMSSTTVEERAELVRRAGRLHSERREELADIVVREMGKSVKDALAEIDFSASIYEFYADSGPSFMADEPITLADTPGSALVRRSPYGVLLGIMPWNYPYYQVARFAGPNLAIGNPILLKPAPQCPESGKAMEAIFHDAGFPPATYINIFAANEQIEWVIADPRLRGVSLTGSGRAGAAVAATAGRHLKKVVLELGGSDPFLLLQTNDLDKAVDTAIAARQPTNAGQACNAGKRFIVVDELYDSFLEKFTAAFTAIKPGDPRAAETTMGPMSSTTAADRLESQVQQAVAQGATLVAGGTREDNFFDATILADIGSESDAYREEFFGPVAQVYRVEDEDEAIRLANDTPFGLGSYVISDDPEQAQRVADQIEAGMVFINTISETAEMPFGGIKNSGFGREQGRYGMDEFVNKKLIRIGA